jgi:hypothetical protein
VPLLKKFAGDFSQSVIYGEQVDVFITVDEEEAIQTAINIVRTAGFNLSWSRIPEQMEL